MPQVQRCKVAGCHALIDRDSLCCDKHKAQEQELRAKRERYSRSRYNKYKRNQDEEKKEQYSFYRKGIWSSLRLNCLKRDNYICLYCLAQGRVTANSKIADHIVPIEVNSALKAELKNLATTCSDCHRLKTKWEQKYYGTGQNNEIKKDAKEIHDIKIISNLMRK